jgi:hypothetical protein
VYPQRIRLLILCVNTQECLIDITYEVRVELTYLPYRVLGEVAEELGEASFLQV